jgi:RND family efflux transporter MFP subunit
MTQSRFGKPLLIAAIIGPWSGCGPGASAPQSKPQGPPPVSVRLAEVQTRSVPRTIEATGSLVGDEETLISAQVGGRVDKVLKDLGDLAGPGESLAQIDQGEYELAVIQARASLSADLARVGLTELPEEDFDLSQVPTVASARAEADNARARLDRGRQLYEESPPVISAQDYADLGTAWEVAARAADVALMNARAALADARTRAAEVAVAGKRLDDATVRAPGREGDPRPKYQVAARSVSEGEYVTPGRAMFRLVASDPVRFRAAVPERFSGEVVVGQDAEAHVEAYREAFAGRVARVSPRIDPASRTFEVEIDIPNPEGRLKPGAFARGSILTRTEEAQFVPESAVITFAGVQKVFSVQDGKAVEHRVQTGMRLEGLVEIVGGLTAGFVVSSGAQALSPNAPVSPSTEAEPTVSQAPAASPK